MIELTPQQHAIATFKRNLHLPGSGFHTLIVELAREFQLPFQEVRKVLKHSQKAVEKKIKHNFDNVTANDLTQDNWLQLIRASLCTLAQDNVPLMETLKKSPHYISAVEAISQSHDTQAHDDEIKEKLALTYEIEVYKPLSAMLYTSILYWDLSDDLFQMTEEKQQKFSGYPQHVSAIRHLLHLNQSNR